MASKTDKAVAHGIRELVSRMHKRLRRQVNTPDQISLTEVNVVSLLIHSKEPMSPSELCAQLNISSQFMSQILNRLDSIGFLIRKPSVADKRKTLISVSKTGFAKIDEMRQQKEEWLANLIADNFNADQKKVIQQALDLLGGLPDL